MIDPRVIGLPSDPEQVRALSLLSERAGGPSEVSGWLDIDVTAAGHLLERMHDAGLVEVVDEELGGGAPESRYQATVRVRWEEEEWMELGVAEQRRLSRWILDTIAADAAEAIDRGTVRPDSHFSRTVVQVDAQGWRELIRIHRDTLDAVLAIQAESAERLAEAGEDGMSVLSALLCCELPPREEAGD